MGFKPPRLVVRTCSHSDTILQLLFITLGWGCLSLSLLQTSGCDLALQPRLSLNWRPSCLSLLGAAGLADVCCQALFRKSLFF